MDSIKSWAWEDLKRSVNAIDPDEDIPYPFHIECRPS